MSDPRPTVHRHDETPDDRATRLIQEEKLERKKDNHRRLFPYLKNLTCLVLLVNAADLRETQRETLYHAMYNRNMDVKRTYTYQTPQGGHKTFIVIEPGDF
eukprot:2437345-Amphidinium_carterae.1